MNGPYYLYRSIVTLMVKKSGAGSFRICEKTDTQQFLVRAVGLSARDIKSEIFKHTGDDAPHKYFYFDFADDAKQAYERACRDYHEFHRTLTDKSHPRPPEGTAYRCPVEGCGYGG